MASQQNKRSKQAKGAQPRDPNPGPVVKSDQAKKTSQQKLRTESIKSSREAARQRYEKNKREMRIIRIGGALLAALLVGLLGYGIFQWAGDQESNDAPEKTVADYSYAGGEHSAEPQVYAETPPVGGTHHDRWQNCGFYPEPVKSEHAVHSIEHGAVWITYDPSLPQDQIDTLKNIAEEQDYILVSAFSGLSSPVVASSWNHQITLDGADDPDLKRFINSYKQGPDTPEPGALCTNGISTTASQQ